MNFIVLTSGITLGLFAGTFGCMELGRRIGARRSRTNPEGADKGLGTLNGAVFALLGLLVAFTFSGAAGRFEARRDLVAQEANSIGTAYLQLDLLAPEDRAAIAADFRTYTTMRIDLFKNQRDDAEYLRRLARTTDLQNAIWAKAIAATRRPGAHPDVAKILLSTLNEMFDITTTRHAAYRNHPPVVIFVMLAVLTLTGALMAGYEMGFSPRREWFQMLIFTAAMALTPYIILDLEYPRFGFIRVDDADVLLVETLDGMK